MNVIKSILVACVLLVQLINSIKLMQMLYIIQVRVNGIEVVEMMVNVFEMVHEVVQRSAMSFSMKGSQL